MSYPNPLSLRLAEAEEMASVLLHHSSQKALLEAVEKQLLRPHTSYLIEKGAKMAFPID